MSGTVEYPFLYEATDAQLQRFFMLTAFVAGKHAGVQQRKLDALLGDWRELYGLRCPFDCLSMLWADARKCVPDSGAEAQRVVKEEPALVIWLQQHKVGQYVRLSRLLFHVAARHYEGLLNLRTCTREDLVTLPGYGLKSASMLMLFTRPGLQLACLDTHILQYMQRKRLCAGIPKTTPSGNEYLRLEKAFLHHCDELGRVPAELDFEIWKENSVTMRGQKFLTEL